MMKNISKPALLSLEFPLPPLADQKALVGALDNGRAQAAKLRIEASSLKAVAWREFEASVYSTNPAAVPTLANQQPAPETAE